MPDCVAGFDPPCYFVSKTKRICFAPELFFSSHRSYSLEMTPVCFSFDFLTFCITVCSSLSAVLFPVNRWCCEVYLIYPSLEPHLFLPSSKARSYPFFMAVVDIFFLIFVLMVETRE